MSYKQKLSKADGYNNVWLTPSKVYKQLDDEFHFDLDPATEPDNHHGTPNFFTEAIDGLKQQWDGNVFSNPPFSNIKLWIKKAYEEHLRERERFIVFLIPARTDTKWFHEYIAPHAEVRFVKGRIKFADPHGVKLNPPFGNMVVIWGGVRPNGQRTTPNIKTIDFHLERNQCEKQNGSKGVVDNAKQISKRNVWGIGL